jgi:hypothetical protein
MDKLWLKLQKIESDLIINNFDKENNCLTKHDAIIFIEDRKLVVKFDTIIKDFINELDATTTTFSLGVSQVS